MTQPKAWHIEDIKAELRKRFGPVTALSRAWGYNKDAISNSLRDPTYSTLIEGRIASALAIPVWKLWPDRWHPNGVPKSRQRPEPNGRASATHRQKQAAA